MGLLDKLNPFSKAIDLASEFITDKDKANELITEIKNGEQQMRLKELETKTIPWVDALHKMGRQIISILSVVAGALLLHFHPEMPLEKMAIIFGPGGIYQLIKGRGR